MFPDQKFQKYLWVPKNLKPKNDLQEAQVF